MPKDGAKLRSPLLGRLDRVLKGTAGVIKLNHILNKK